MTTLLTFAPAYGHTKFQHPESSQRTAALWRSLERSGLLSQVRQLEPVAATVDQLRRVHTPQLIEYVHQVSLRGGGLLDHGDTYVTAQSFELAQLAAGGCCAAVDAIMTLSLIHI